MRRRTISIAAVIWVPRVGGHAPPARLVGLDEAVVDNNLVTSRKPDDIPAFSRELIKMFAANRAHRRAA